MKRSADWPDLFLTAESWFDVDDAVTTLLRAKPKAKQAALYLEHGLPERRAAWALRFAWTGLAAARDKGFAAHARDLGLVARAVLDGHDLSTIPVMRHIARMTAEAFSAAR